MRRRRRVYALRARNGGAFGFPAPRIVLSGNAIAENSPAGTPVGTLSAVNASGTPVFNLDNNAGNRFALDGNVNLQAGAVATDFESATSHNITISVTGVSPPIAPAVFTILVTDVAEGGGAAAQPIGLLLALTKAA